MPYPAAPTDGDYHVEDGERRRFVAADGAWVKDSVVADVTALNALTGQVQGEIVTVAASGRNYQWNASGAGSWDIWARDTNLTKLYPHLMATTATNSVEIQADFDSGALKIGDSIRTSRYYGDGNTYGGTDYVIVATGTGTADGGSYIDFTGFQLQGQFSDEGVGVTQFGARGDNTTDDSAAIQAACIYATQSSGGTVRFAPGTYVAGDVTVPAATGIVLEGANPEITVLKLTPAGSNVFLALDVVAVTVRGLKFDADTANATGGALQDGLFRTRTTAATATEKDFSVLVENCVFTGHSPVAQGHIRIQIFEQAGAVFPEFDRIVIRNCRFFEHGMASGGACGVRGPGKTIVIEGCTADNGGINGIQAVGDGIDSKLFTASTEVAFGHFIEHMTVRDCKSANVANFLFMQMVSGANIEGNTVTGTAVNPALDVADTFTADIAGNTITPAGGLPAGFVAPGAMVRVEGVDLPAPLVSGNAYYVRDAGPAYQLATAVGHGAIDLTAPGSGVFNMTWLGMGYNVDIKADDCDAPDAEVGGGAVHYYTNNRFTGTSLHRGHRNISYEVSTPGLVNTPRVVIDGCSFDNQVNLSPGKQYKTSATFRSSSVAVDPTASSGSASPIAINNGLIEDCYFGGTSSPTIEPGNFVTFRGCRFALGVVFSAPTQPTVIRLDGNLFNELNDADRVAVDLLTPQVGAGPMVVDMVRNRAAVQGSTFESELRVQDQTGTLDQLTVFGAYNDLSRSTFGVADTPEFRYVSSHTHGFGADARRGSVDYPLQVLPAAGSATIAGNEVWLTSGVGTSYFTFGGEIDYATLTIYVQVGDEIVHGTGNIRTATGQNIPGPAVVRLYRYDGAWRELGGTVSGGATASTGSFTGNGATVAFNIAHGLNIGVGVPQIQLRNTTTNEVNPPGGPAYAWVDADTVTATFTVAPANGVVYEWRAV